MAIIYVTGEFNVKNEENEIHLHLVKLHKKICVLSR
jgi:hypothetical protein